MKVLYSRLLACKSLASQLANDPMSPFTANSVASELALLDNDAPELGLLNLQKQNLNPAAYFYDYLLESCERLFDNVIEQQMFEDICRHMFGTKVCPTMEIFLLNLSCCKTQAYTMFTIDKVLGSLLKQVQSILSDKSIRLCEGLKRERELVNPAIQDLTDLRLNAEKIIGSEENLFRIDWVGFNFCFFVFVLL